MPHCHALSQRFQGTSMLQATVDPLELLPAENVSAPGAGWAAVLLKPCHSPQHGKVQPEKCRLVEGHAAKSELVF